MHFSGARLIAQPFSPTRFPDSSPHPCFLCFLSDDDGGIDDCEKGSERDARDWFGSAGRTRGARPREAGAAGCRGARKGKGVLRRRNDAESPQGRRRGCGGLERRKGTGDRSMILLFLLPPLSHPSRPLASLSIVRPLKESAVASRAPLARRPGAGEKHAPAVRTGFLHRPHLTRLTVPLTLGRLLPKPNTLPRLDSFLRRSRNSFRSSLARF